MHNRALLLQQPRRNSYGIRVHLTCPGVFARSPPTAAVGNIRNSTCCEWDHLKRIRPGPWMMEGRWYDHGCASGGLCPDDR
jgi:hypothetical protein